MKLQKLLSSVKMAAVSIFFLFSAAVLAEPNTLESRLTALEDQLKIHELISKYAWAIDSGALMEPIAGVFTQDAVADYITVGDHRPLILNEHLVGIEQIQAWLHQGLAERANGGAGATIPLVPSHTFNNTIIDLDGDKADVRFAFVSGGGNYTAAYQVEAVKLNGAWFFKTLRHEARVKDGSFITPGSRYANPENQ